MTPQKRRPQSGGDCGASEKVLAGGFDFLRDKPQALKKTSVARVPTGAATVQAVSQAYRGMAVVSAVTKMMVATDVVADLNFRRQVERLHRFGPRVTAELLDEIAAERSIQTAIDQKLDRYTDLDPATIEAAGGGEFWPAPLRLLRIAGLSGTRAIKRASKA